MIGLGIRLYDLTDPPLDFDATRQLHSALKTRGYYYAMLSADATDGKSELAINMGEAIETLEPPVIEWLTAISYRLMGGETLWIARLYSIIFWTLAGVALFLLAKEMIGKDSAIIALAYFLLLPFGAIASRTFMPDPLMVMLILFSWWGVVYWQQAPTWKWSIIAGLLGGLTILCKFTAIFFVAGAFIGAVLGCRSLHNAVRNSRVWVMGILALMPYAIYFIYAKYIANFLDVDTFRFFPHLWLEPAFYLRWTEAINGTVNLEWAVVGLLGTCLLRVKTQRAMLIGAWLGYFIYGMTLPYHIITHDYYQLPLIPLVAFGLAATANVIWQNMQGHPRLVYSLTIVLFLFGVGINTWNVRVKLKEVDYHGEAIFWQQLGEQLGPQAKIAGLTHDYGFRLAFWGWVSSSNWMTSSDFALRELAGQDLQFDALFEEATAGKDYFLVTLINELDSQPALKEKLYNNYPVDEKPGYLLFDLRHPLQPSS